MEVPAPLDLRRCLWTSLLFITGQHRTPRLPSFDHCFSYRCLALETDVSKAPQVDQLFQATSEAFGPIGIAVNNAGVGAPLTPLGDTEESDFDRIMAVNLKGVWLCMRAALLTCVYVCMCVCVCVCVGGGLSLLFAVSRHTSSVGS